jgi:hypothetical protein
LATSKPGNPFCNLSTKQQFIIWDGEKIPLWIIIQTES